MAALACNSLVKQAIDERLTRVGILMVAGSVAPAVANRMRALTLPKSAKTEVSANPVSEKPEAAVLQAQSQKRIDELTVQYNSKSIESKDFQLTVAGKVLKADPLVSKGAPVYEGASTFDVMRYFKELAGIEDMPMAKVIPEQGLIYVANTASGSKMVLRNFSSSSQKTGASWAIDVIDSSINQGRRVEI